MRTIRAAFLRLAGLFGRSRRDRDLEAELESHLQLHIDDNLRTGLTPAEARRQALLKLGGSDQTKEAYRDRRGLPLVDQFLTDVRFGLRMLFKERGVTAAAIMALALGIGANTAVFTIVNAVLFRGLPFDQPERLMWLDTQDARGRSLGVSLQDFDDLRRDSRTLSGLALIFNPGLPIADDQPPTQYPGAYISATGFAMIGAHPARGRGFRDDDERPGAPAVALLSDSVWKSRYGADPSIIGRVVHVNSLSADVIGVMPEGFAFPYGEQVWLPMSQLPPAFQQRGRQSRFFTAYGRLADGVTPEQCRDELASISAHLAAQFPDTNKDVTTSLTPFLERAVDPQTRTLSWALLAAVGFVLLIACANVANLLLARSGKRSREIAIRTSLGASRSRIVRQLLVESVLLSFAGGGIGVILAVSGIRWFDANTQDLGRPDWMDFTMDAHVVAFFGGVCVLTGILFGLAPALHVSRAQANDVLRDGGRSATGGLRARRWAGALVVAELTLTLVLLSAAGLMMRSFLNLYHMDVGLDSSHLLTMRIVLPARKYPTKAQVQLFLQRVDDRLNAVPMIVAASTTTSLPMSGIDYRQLTIDGHVAAPDETPPHVMMISVGARYFEAAGVRLLRGRPMQDLDGMPGHEVAVINQLLAAKYFPNEDPIGKRIALVDDTPAGSKTPWATIVGVAPTIRERTLQEAPDGVPVAYIPNVQNVAHRNGTFVLVRTRADSAQVTARLRHEIFELDPDLPLGNINTMDELLALQRWSARVYGSMFAAFAAMALLLAGVGLYAVTAYSVTQRTAEIGIRLALGAQRRHIVWLVVRRVVVYIGVGLVIGSFGTVGVGKLLAAVLVQTTPTDTLTLMSTTVILVLVAALACLIPTRRAMSLDPVVALRYE